MVDHLIQGDGQGGFVTGHDIRCGIPHQENIHPGAIQNSGHGKIIRRQHGDFFSGLLHFGQGMGRNPLDFAVYGHALELKNA